MRTLAALVFSLLLSNLALARDSVRLVNSFNLVHTRYGITNQTAMVKFLVDDSVQSEDVNVIFEQDGQDPQVVAATHHGYVPGYAVWIVNAALSEGEIRFQVQVDGERATDVVRLDSNGGAVIHSGTQVGVIHEGYFPSEDRLNLVVAVKNLAYRKKVRVIYSVDNWETKRSQELDYLPLYTWGYGIVNGQNSKGFELWNTSVTLPSAARQLKYYLTYEVDGRTYFDNNFGANYTISTR